MKCPTCGENTPDAWEPLWRQAERGGQIHAINRGTTGLVSISLDYMQCANPRCQEAVIRVHQTLSGGLAAKTRSERGPELWYACPRGSSRRVDPRVPEPFRRDYNEAAAILGLSPRMSAVLSRRIMGDLLKAYAGKDHFSLTARIDSFTSESGRPSTLTDNLHHFREIADFGAHTQEDQEAAGEVSAIIDVDREEAEWTLDLVDRLFDYFIVTPAKDEAVRRKMDEKIEKAGRKPLRPGAEEREP